jgi:hypothetical protein
MIVCKKGTLPIVVADISQGREIHLGMGVDDWLYGLPRDVPDCRKSTIIFATLHRAGQIVGLSVEKAVTHITDGSVYSLDTCDTRPAGV